MRQIPSRSIATPLITLGALLALMLPAVSRAECANEQIRQENNSANLPDCRAYEQVSPSEKDGGSGGVFDFDSPSQAEGPAGALPIRALADGSAITYPGEPIFSVESVTREKVEQEGTFREQYTSERSAAGWSTHLGNALGAEAAPEPALPTSTETSVQFVEDARVVEETPSGSKVFFLDEAELARVSNAAPGEPDLYEYTTPSAGLPHGSLADLTDDKTEHADVQGILGVGGEGADEGTYVYFVAGASLAPGAPSGACGTNNEDATGTGCKLYLRHNGVTTLIATLSSKDELGSMAPGTSVADWKLAYNERTAEVAPSGRYVVFGSNLGLTGQDATAPEIFRYDSVAAENHEQSLTCVSCSPAGAPPLGASLSLLSTGAQINGADRQRYILNDGRVLFDTPNALVAQDVNHRSDVYEWEPSGAGDCISSSGRFSSITGGCVGLISGGMSETSSSVFADASANGSDIFFTTSQPLVPQDQDEITDVYDAREGGRFPLPPVPVCLVKAACPNPRATPPTLAGPPASATFFATESPPVIVASKAGGTSKPLTRAQRLMRALETCHHERKKKKRVACEKTARRKYGKT